MDPDWVDVCPIKNGNLPASYASVPKGRVSLWLTFKRRGNISDYFWAHKLSDLINRTDFFGNEI